MFGSGQKTKVGITSPPRDDESQSNQSQSATTNGNKAADGAQVQFTNENLFEDFTVTHQRSKSMQGDRSQFLKDFNLDQQAKLIITRDPTSVNPLSQSFDSRRNSVEIGSFNRKKDRMNFKHDPSKVIKREYIDGTPLLTDLNEILNLDVISIAMEELSAQKRRQRKQKVLKEDYDPDVYVDQIITFEDPSLPDILNETKKGEIIEERQVDSIYHIDAQKQVVRWLRNEDDRSRMDVDSDDDPYDDGVDGSESESYMSDDAANKRALQCMMTGEYPDAEIDKLLETFGVQANQIGSIPEKDIFQGQMIENDLRINVDLKELIDNIKFVYKNWSSKKLTDKKRKQFLQNLYETSDYLGVSLAVEHLLPGLLDIVVDRTSEQEQYQGQMVILYSELGKLITFLSKSEITAGYEAIRDHLMPIYSEFFLSSLLDDEVRLELHDQCIQQLSIITKVLIYEDRAEVVLPIVLELLKDDEEKRLIGLELLDVLAVDFGAQICQNYLVYEIVSLQDDPRYKVRKETVKRIVNISKVVSNEMFLGVLLPVFKKLCTDQIWGVRRQAVEVLPEICKLAPNDIKNGALLDIFKRFTQDQNKWVKQAATQFLGPFIVCYMELEPSPDLLIFYKEIVTTNLQIDTSSGVIGSQSVEDILYHCAYNFPAVLLTLGKDSWVELKEIYHQLVIDPRLKIRKTLAYSLFEIAKIVGPEITRSELVEVLFEFLKDIDQVKDGALESLPEFVAQLEADKREEYAERLSKVWVANELDWRKKDQQAVHIGQLANLLSPQVYSDHFLPTFFELCEDGFAIVRNQATIKSFYPVFKLMAKDAKLLSVLVEKVIAFKKASNYTLRQAFITMCQSVFVGDKLEKSEESEQLFIDHLLDHFADLQSDKIVNVRLQLAETLALLYQKNERMEKIEDVKSPDSILSTDASMVKRQESKVLQGPVHKVYSQSRICMHPKIISMVSRLRVDSNRDIQKFLRHINLPEAEEQVDIDAVIQVHKSARQISDYEKRGIEKTEKILKIVEKDNSGGKSESTINMLKQIHEDETKQAELERAKDIEVFVDHLLSNIYSDALTAMESSLVNSFSVEEREELSLRGDKSQLRLKLDMGLESFVEELLSQIYLDACREQQV